MSTLQHQMAAINFRTVNVVAQLKELNELRADPGGGALCLPPAAAFRILVLNGKAAKIRRLN